MTILSRCNSVIACQARSSFSCLDNKFLLDIRGECQTHYLSTFMGGAATRGGGGGSTVGVV